MATQTPPLTKKDFQSDQEVRWCPGCGDYAILKSVQSVLPSLGIPKERFVFVSGIGCSSRFPYYMSTYGFHTIHGRAFPIASGVKLANPDLSVWVVTGDGDALSIGGNHIIHLLRRNIDVNVLLFNNRIYGLTKGQISPTSEQGKTTKSTPFGSVDPPFNPLALAIGAGATFVARSVDIYAKHLQEMLTRAVAHKGTSFVEIYQNCNIFNDGAFTYMTEKKVRTEQQVELEHGKPMIFGTNDEKALTFDDSLQPKVVNVADVDPGSLVTHDETAESAALSFGLAQATPPNLPTPIGVFRAVERGAYEVGVHDQVKAVIDRDGPGDLARMLAGGDTWQVS